MMLLYILISFIFFSLFNKRMVYFHFYVWKIIKMFLVCMVYDICIAICEFEFTLYRNLLGWYSQYEIFIFRDLISRLLVKSKEISIISPQFLLIHFYIYISINYFKILYRTRSSINWEARGGIVHSTSPSRSINF